MEYLLNEQPRDLRMLPGFRSLRLHSPPCISTSLSAIDNAISSATELALLLLLLLFGRYRSYEPQLAVGGVAGYVAAGRVAVHFAAGGVAVYVAVGCNSLAV